MYLKKQTKKELQEDVEFYELFYSYVKQNNYNVYSNAVSHAIKKTNN